jgi:SulP family sulfate permease
LTSPDVGCLVLDCVAIDFIDSQGSAKLREIVELTDQAGMTLRLVRMKPAVSDLLDRDGVLERVGRDHVHQSIAAAVDAHMAEAGGP